MTFGLGVDLGTTFTAAATVRNGQLAMATLGDRSSAIPSVLMIRDDGSTLVGEVADRQAASAPSRVAREVKRRLGDPTPLILGGEPHSAAQIMSRMLASVVSSIAEREGADPDALVLTHPANWGPYKRELFGSVPRLADLPAATMISEPEAAAVHYASNARVAEGSVVAVYDLGGGTFDATVLRKLDQGFELLGPPEGIEGLGGIDFDEAVFAYVDRCTDGAVSQLDLDDPRDAADLIRLRRECVLAKETLSSDTEATISVSLSTLRSDVRLTRSELEEMIRSPIDSTVSSLRRALTAAKTEPDDLSTVLLVGGSSRIPLVSQMLSAELGRPTVVDTHPKHAVALGAALIAGLRLRSGPTGRPAAPTAPPRASRATRGAAVPAGSAPASPRQNGPTSWPTGRTPVPPAAPSLGGPAPSREQRPAGSTAGPSATPSPPPSLSPSSTSIPRPPSTAPERSSPPSASAVSGSVSTSSDTPSTVLPVTAEEDDPPETSLVSAPGAAVPPPPLKRSRQKVASTPATRRQRLRTAAICVGVAVLLVLAVFAVVAALTDRNGLGATPPGAPPSSSSSKSSPSSTVR